MKITHITTHLVRIPARPIAPMPAGMATPTHDYVTLELGTDQGLRGIGFSSCGDVLSAALKAAGGDILAGVIAGRAVYDGRVHPRDAQALLDS